MSAEAKQVKKLREKTGAGILDCKRALEAESDFEKAIEWLKKKNLSSAGKKSHRTAQEGRISSYIHGEGRLGVLLEVNSETDFVARNTEFMNFTRDLSLHIAAMNPEYIEEKDIPSSRVDREKAIFEEQARQKSQNEKVQANISEGLYKKWLQEICLAHQDFVRPSQTGKETVKDALNQLSAKVGENVVIRRFARFSLGEVSEEKKQEA